MNQNQQDRFNKVLMDCFNTQININDTLEDRVRILEMEMLGKHPPKKNMIITNTRAVQRLIREFS